jgi:hypothetical protein
MFETYAPGVITALVVVVTIIVAFVLYLFITSFMDDDTSSIADNAITTAKIADGAVTEDKLDDKVVAKLNEGSEVPDNSISQDKLQVDSVGTANIQTKAITFDKLSDEIKTNLARFESSIQQDLESSNMFEENVRLRVDLDPPFFNNDYIVISNVGSYQTNFQSTNKTSTFFEGMLRFQLPLTVRYFSNGIPSGAYINMTHSTSFFQPMNITSNGCSHGLVALTVDNTDKFLNISNTIVNSSTFTTMAKSLNLASVSSSLINSVGSLKTYVASDAGSGTLSSAPMIGTIRSGATNIVFFELDGNEADGDAPSVLIDMSVGIPSGTLDSPHRDTGVPVKTQGDIACLLTVTYNPSSAGLNLLYGIVNFSTQKYQWATLTSLYQESFWDQFSFAFDQNDSLKLVMISVATGMASVDVTQFALTLGDASTDPTMTPTTAPVHPIFVYDQNVRQSDYPETYQVLMSEPDNSGVIYVYLLALYQSGNPRIDVIRFTWRNTADADFVDPQVIHSFVEIDDSFNGTQFTLKNSVSADTGVIGLTISINSSNLANGSTFISSDGSEISSIAHVSGSTSVVDVAIGKTEIGNSNPSCLFNLGRQNYIAFNEPTNSETYVIGQ